MENNGEPSKAVASHPEHTYSFSKTHVEIFVFKEGFKSCSTGARVRLQVFLCRSSRFQGEFKSVFKTIAPEPRDLWVRILIPLRC